MFFLEKWLQLLSYIFRNLILIMNPCCFTVGLDAAGKTTILYKLKLGEIVTTIPTIGKKTELFLIWLWSQSSSHGYIEVIVLCCVPSHMSILSSPGEFLWNCSTCRLLWYANVHWLSSYMWLQWLPECPVLRHNIHPVFH